jgi:hypothetical protein
MKKEILSFNFKKRFGSNCHVARENMMSNLRKCMVVSGLAVIGVVGMIFMSRTSRQNMGTYGKMGQNIDEGLKNTIDVLANATAHVQSVYEQIKNRKL